MRRRHCGWRLATRRGCLRLVLRYCWRPFPRCPQRPARFLTQRTRLWREPLASALLARLACTLHLAILSPFAEPGEQCPRSAPNAKARDRHETKRFYPCYHLHERWSNRRPRLRTSGPTRCRPRDNRYRSPLVDVGRRRAQHNRRGSTRYSLEIGTRGLFVESNHVHSQIEPRVEGRRALGHLLQSLVRGPAD